MMDYYAKYIKYKEKYLLLKNQQFLINQTGGSIPWAKRI